MRTLPGAIVHVAEDDCQTVLTGGPNQPVRVHDLWAGKEPVEWPEFPANVVKIVRYPYSRFVTLQTRKKQLQILDLHLKKEMVLPRPGDLPVWVRDGWKMATVEGRKFALWDGLTGREEKVHWLPSPVRALATNRWGWFVVGDQSGAVIQLDPDSGRTSRLYEHLGPVHCLGLSENGELVVSAGEDGMIRSWDVRAGRLRSIHKGHTGRINQIAILGDDSRLLASASEDGTVKLWPLQEPQDYQTLQTAIRPSGPLAYSADGRLLAVADQDHSVKLLDAVSGTVRATLRGHLMPITSVAISPDSKTVAASGRNWNVQLWDAGTGEQLADLGDDGGVVRAVTFSPDGQWLASAGQTGHVLVRHPRTGQILHTLKGHTAEVACLAFAPDSKSLASAGWDQTVRLWDPVTGKDQVTFQEGSPLVSLAWSPDGQRLAAARTDGTATLRGRGPEGWQPPQPIAHDNARIQSVAFVPEAPRKEGGAPARGGRSLGLALGEEHTVAFWDLMQGDVRREYAADFLQNLALAPKGKTLATTSRNGLLELWGLDRHHVLRPFGQALSPVHALATGSRAAPGRIRKIRWFPDKDKTHHQPPATSYEIRLWDRVTRTELPPLEGQALLGVRGLAYHPDGNTLASAGGGGTLWLWDLARRQSLRPALLFLNPAARLYWRLWESSQQSYFGTATEFPVTVAAVALSPDGRTLAVASNLGDVALWEVPGANNGSRSLSVMTRSLALPFRRTARPAPPTTAATSGCGT